MGKRLNKDDMEGAHKHVVQIHDGGARKRDGSHNGSSRKEGVMTKTDGLKLAGFGLVGLLIGGSLLRGVSELLMSDSNDEVATPLKVAEKSTVAGLLVSGVGALLVGELKTFALEYARRRITEKLEESKQSA